MEIKVNLEIYLEPKLFMNTLLYENTLQKSVFIFSNIRFSNMYIYSNKDSVKKVSVKNLKMMTFRDKFSVRLKIVGGDCIVKQVSIFNYQHSYLIRSAMMSRYK